MPRSFMGYDLTYGGIVQAVNPRRGIESVSGQGRHQIGDIAGAQTRSA